MHYVPTGAIPHVHTKSSQSIMNHKLIVRVHQENVVISALDYYCYLDDFFLWVLWFHQIG